MNKLTISNFPISQKVSSVQLCFPLELCEPHFQSNFLIHIFVRLVLYWVSLLSSQANEMKMRKAMWKHRNFCSLIFPLYLTQRIANRKNEELKNFSLSPLFSFSVLIIFFPPRRLYLAWKFALAVVERASIIREIWIHWWWQAGEIGYENSKLIEKSAGLLSIIREWNYSFDSLLGKVFSLMNNQGFSQIELLIESLVIIDFQVGMIVMVVESRW